MNILTAVAVILLHNAEGMELLISVDHIAVLHPTKESVGKAPKNQLVVGGVNCVVGMANGKFFSVIEDCPTIRKMMEAAK